MTEQMDTSKLNPSKLGTKQYWDDFYKVEKANFEENPEDTGECWFDDSDAEFKMVGFLFDSFGELPTIREDSSIVDLGTGNGHLLFQIREEGFKGELVGVDYSEISVDLATSIAENNGFENIKFMKSDLLDDKDLFLQQNQETYDIIMDKGTFDAILLNDLRNGDGKLGVEIYPHNVQKLLKLGGVLLITSCNFTSDELCKLIMASGNFKYWQLIEYPSFEFGGVKGSTICSIAFIKQQ